MKKALDIGVLVVGGTLLALCAYRQVVKMWPTTEHQRQERVAQFVRDNKCPLMRQFPAEDLFSEATGERTHWDARKVYYCPKSETGMVSIFNDEVQP